MVVGAVAMLLQLQQRYDITQFGLWRHTMYEWVMEIHYQAWIAQGRVTNIIIHFNVDRQNASDSI